jgi:hypothetical protein
VLIKITADRFGLLYRLTWQKLAIFAFSPDDEPVTAIKAAL